MQSAVRPTNGFANHHPQQQQQQKKKTPVLANGSGGGSGENRYDARFKVLMIGNSGVGKSSMLQSLMGQPFNPGTISTIGIDLIKKIFIVDNHRIQLEVWDTAGQEQYYSIVALHFRDTKAFIIVYDMTDVKTFDQIRKYWLRTIDQHMDEPVPVFLAANKCDLASGRLVTLEDGEKLASQQCAHGYFETSSKTGENITNLFQKVAEALVATWGAPKRWYEVDVNGDLESKWPNQDEHQNVLNLTDTDRRGERAKCCRSK